MSCSARRAALRSTASSICGRSTILAVAPGFSKDRSLMYWPTTWRLGTAGWAGPVGVPSLLIALVFHWECDQKFAIGRYHGSLGRDKRRAGSGAAEGRQK